MSHRAAATLALVFVLTLAFTAGSSTAAVTSAQTEIPDSEYQALVALYNATDGPTWGPRFGWMLDASPCSWGGVTCEEGHVTWLMVGIMACPATLPPELGNLSYLKTLDVCFNPELAGTIPPELGNLSALERLGSAIHSLPAPSPPVGNLSSLKSLSLWGNDLTGSIPPELGALTNLKNSVSRLSTRGNDSSRLGNLTNLRVLGIEQSRVSGPIPPELGNLTNLTGLYLSFDALTAPSRRNW
jgi:hypothetical protein